jgi:hypothetical protein
MNSKLFSEINSHQEILTFLKTKVKDTDEDPDQKWKTTYRGYLHRIKHFFWMVT